MLMPSHPSGPETCVERGSQSGRHAKPWTPWSRLLDLAGILQLPSYEMRDGRTNSPAEKPLANTTTTVEPPEGMEVRDGVADNRNTPAKGVRIVDGTRQTNDVIVGGHMIPPIEWLIERVCEDTSTSARV